MMLLCLLHIRVPLTLYDIVIQKGNNLWGRYLGLLTAAAENVLVYCTSYRNIFSARDEKSPTDIHTTTFSYSSCLPNVVIATSTNSTNSHFFMIPMNRLTWDDLGLTFGLISAVHVLLTCFSIIQYNVVIMSIPVLGGWLVTLLGWLVRWLRKCVG
jgi:hypothetical protein